MSVDAAESGQVPEQPLVDRPRPAWSDHRPVVEPDRRERAADLVDDRQQVVVERAEDVLRLHLDALAHGFDAHADVWDTVDLHQAVRTASGAAEQASRAMVLEAPREHAPAGGVQGGADRVAHERPDARALETEADLPAAVEPLARLWRQPHASRLSRFGPGTTTRCTSFVRVSRPPETRACSRDDGTTIPAGRRPRCAGDRDTTSVREGTESASVGS